MRSLIILRRGSHDGIFMVFAAFRSWLSRFPPTVLLLGAVSFFTDVSSEMIFPLLPVFLTTFLGASAAAVGLIEGVADSAASLLDIVIGYAADRRGSYKKFVAWGYGLSSFVKLGIALAATWPQVLLLRGVERIGKSIRSSPRDAIIARSSTPSNRGTAFGLHRAMDTLGAITGPAVAYVILSLMGSGESAYRTVFGIAVLPAFVAVLIIVLFLREPKRETGKKSQPASGRKKLPFFAALRSLDSNYRRFLLISALFSLSYFSFALLIVRAVELGISAPDILLLYLLYNLIYALVSVPIGALSDRIGRRVVIAASFALYGLICLGFALVSAWWQVALLFALYGVFVSADESVNKAYVSDLVGEERRATALGAYNTGMGAVYLPANALFGAAWAALGAGVAFGGAALIAFAAAAWMLAFREKGRK
ncbi:Multidrug resistance protein MdtG [uncultured archaeon]|nr:Multidrug resistance protein MdtG [uncultured archaeon]